MMTNIRKLKVFSSICTCSKRTTYSHESGDSSYQIAHRYTGSKSYQKGSLNHFYLYASKTSRKFMRHSMIQPIITVQKIRIYHVKTQWINIKVLRQKSFHPSLRVSQMVHFPNLDQLGWDFALFCLVMKSGFMAYLQRVRKNRSCFVMIVKVHIF